jgi:hypothetical protein
MGGVPVLVVSCDRYSDVWRPFFELFWRRWPDCAGPVYLGTNFLRHDDQRVQSLPIGPDVTWASGVRRMLDRLDSDYVLVMLEDFLLTEPVDNARIERLARLARAEQPGCLRLYSILPPPRSHPRHPELGWFAPGDPYRITAQAAIWRVSTLRRLLVPGFSPWDFEFLGTQLARGMPDAIWGVREPALVYDQAVEKGRWRPQGVAICLAAGVEIDRGARPVFTREELERHERSAIPGARFAERKHAALDRFEEGDRVSGLRELLWCLRRQPLSLQLWGIAATALLGRRAIGWLRRAHLRLSVARAAHQYRRALRAPGRPVSTPPGAGQAGGARP